MATDHFRQTIGKLAGILFSLGILVILLLGLIITLVFYPASIITAKKEITKPEVDTDFWQAPDASLIIQSPNAEMIAYGRDLIINTALYLGPKGAVAQISNGMNCQNCHLDAGTKPFGNNYSAVAANYPKFRARSGTEESIEKRVNDCFERSLNGKSLSDTSKEMRAIKAYILWVGQGVSPKTTPKGAGLLDLAYMERSADPAKGRQVYEQKCTICHGEQGQGMLAVSGHSYIYPPLWGENSYNIGAGLYRLSRFAGYVKANMPLGASFDRPQLTDEEAWDVAAYINTQYHPMKDLSADWPDVSKKPVDHPFGPFADEFSEEQHKLGPFEPIVKSRKTETLSQK